MLDGQTVQAVATAEFLKRVNCKVILLCDSKNSYGYHTKYADKKILSPPTKRREEFIQFLKRFLDNYKIDVIIPMNDNSASILSINRETFKKKSNFVIPDEKIFYNGFDKNQLMGLCRKFDFPHPKTADLEKETLNDACDHVGFPAILKPNITSGGRGMQLIKSRDDLIRKLDSTRKVYGSCHLQEFILPGGKQYKVQIYRDNSNTNTYSTVLEKIRFYPEKGGSSCFNKTIKHDDLVFLCNKVLEKLNWDGFADFDLIEDPKDNIIKIMEINPRIPACIKSSYISGINFAQIIVYKSVGIEIPQMSYKPNMYLRYFALDILWFFQSPRRFRTKPSWFIFISKNLYYQDFSWEDPMPFIIGLFGGFLKYINPKFRKAKRGLKQ